jgi:hypothetical protein
MSILDGRRLGKGTQDWCERQDRFGLDLQINREGVAVQTSQGGKGQRCARNSEFPSYCARKLCRDIFSPFAGNLLLRPGDCRLSHVGQQIYSISRDAFSCLSQYCLLDHRFPLLVTLFAIIGLPFLFSHTGARRPVLSPSPQREAELSCVDKGPRGIYKEHFKGTKTSL